MMVKNSERKIQIAMHVGFKQYMLHSIFVVIEGLKYK